MFAKVQRGFITQHRNENEWEEELIPVDQIKNNDLIPHYILRDGIYIEFYGQKIPEGETLYCVKNHIENLENDPDKKSRYIIAKRIYDFYLFFKDKIEKTHDLNDRNIQTVLGILFGWRFNVTPSHTSSEWVGPNSRSEMHPRFQIGLDNLIQAAKDHMTEEEALLLFNNVLKNDVKSFDEAPKILIEKILEHIASNIIRFKKQISYFEKCMYFVLENDLQEKSLEDIIIEANLQDYPKQDILNAFYTLEKGGFIQRKFAIKTQNGISYLNEEENSFTRLKFKVKRKFPSPENNGKFRVRYDDVNSPDIITYWETK